MICVAMDAGVWVHMFVCVYVGAYYILSAWLSFGYRGSSLRRRRGCPLRLSIRLVGQQVGSGVLTRLAEDVTTFN